MSYINFKEEVFVAQQQLKKRNNNNNKLISQMKHKKQSLINLYNEKYSFKEIKDKVINNVKIQKEEDFIHIVNEKIACAHFIECRFNNIRFFKCSFIGCIFENCDFGGGGVVFENCTFLKAESDDTPSLNIKDNLSCTFKNCSIYAKFLCSDISYAVFDNCILKNMSFELTVMKCMIVIHSEIDKANISDSDLCGIKVLKTYMKDLEFNDNVNSKLDEKSFFDKIPVRCRSRQEYEGIYMLYETIGNEFNNNNLRNNFGEYYYLARCSQRKTLNLLPRIISTIELLTAGYGERIFTPLIASLVMILIFSVIYIFTGFIIDGRTIKYGLDIFDINNFRQLLTDLNVALTLSIGVFGGVGADIAVPTGEAYIVSNIEMILGVIMIGVGIGTLTRKIIR